jgi:comEA protein
MPLQKQNSAASTKLTIVSKTLRLLCTTWYFSARIFVPGLLLMALAMAGSLVAATTKKPPLKPVNINTATSAELQQVPGIGPVTAEKILQTRKSYGAFKSVDDLSAIRGIGPKRLAKMRKYLTVGHSGAAAPASGTFKAPNNRKAKDAAPAKIDTSKDGSPSTGNLPAPETEEPHLR